MRKILKRTLGRGAEDEKGFTLIELLVVVGIIMPLVIQFSGKGDEGVKAADENPIQAAVYAMMADKTLTTVTANASSAKITT